MIENYNYDDDDDRQGDDDDDDDQDDGARQPRWTSPQCEGSAQSCLQWHGQGHHARSVHPHN